MNTIKIDWLKLDAFNKKISLKILKRLPKDWKLSIEDIQSEVNETFIKLIKLYNPMIGGWSLTTYCYQYAEKITFDRLMKEYTKLKKQISINDAFIKKYDNDYMHHQYGYYDVMPYFTIDRQIELQDIVDQLLSINNNIDRSIIELILFQDMKYADISNKLHISPSTISRRLKKYSYILKH